MATKYFVKRKTSKRIFEEGEQQTPTQAAPAAAPAQADANQAAQAPAQPAAPAQQNQNAQQQPQQQQAQPAQSNNQQPAQQQAPEQAQPSEKEQKVTACINHVTETIKKNDPYALIAMNIPDIIKNDFKDFATAPDAAEARDKWEAFKKTPTAESFKAFTDALVNFGKAGQEQAPAQQQQAAAQPTAAAPAPAQAAQNAQQQQAESEYRSFTFSQRLTEKLNDRLRMSNAQKTIADYSKRFDF